MPGSPNHGGGVVDLGSLLGGKLAEVLLDTVDEVLQPTDLGMGRHGLGLGPLLQVDRGEHSLAILEQVVQVCLEIGQVGDVGAEMVADDAPEPVGAGAAAGTSTESFRLRTTKRRRTNRAS